MAQELYATFLRSQPRTNKVISFFFRPEKPLEYIAGQFAQVIFDENNRTNKDLNKYLSFSSRPGQPEWEVTKKVSESNFTKRLLALKAGERVLFKAPMGNTVVTPEMQKVAFLIGGIGITPVIAIIDDIVARELPTDVCLLYSNWTAQDIAYKKELDAWSQAHKNIRVVHILVECRPEDQACFSGIITAPLVEQQIPDYKERMIFNFGPPGMVKAMEEICTKLGCDKTRVKSENFVGY